MQPSGGEVDVLISRGRSWRRGGETARPPVRGREDVLLAPDMARRRDSASRAGRSRCACPEGRSARLEVGRSGVLGHGTAMVVSVLKVSEGSGGVRRSAGWTFVSPGVIGLGAGLGPNSFWSSRVGDLGRSVGCVVSSLKDGVCGWGACVVVDFAELFGELIVAFGEGTMMRGEAERARGEAWRICFGRGGRGRFIGGRGAIKGMLCFGVR